MTLMAADNAFLRDCPQMTPMAQRNAFLRGKPPMTLMNADSAFLRDCPQMAQRQGLSSLCPCQSAGRSVPLW
jgi:hypothetical protein